MSFDIFRGYIRQKYSGIEQANHREVLPLADALVSACEIRECTMQGADLSSALFVDCTLKEVDWYWCMAFRAVFINCTFEKCDLRGAFDEVLFLKCTFKNCECGHDNLGGKTEWANAEAIDCEFENTKLPITNDSDIGERKVRVEFEKYLITNLVDS